MSSIDALIQETNKAVAEFRQLSTDDKLGLLWVVYENMGNSITPAAPGAASPQFTQNLLDQVREMQQEQQLGFMRDLIEKTRTDYTQQYTAYTNDNKLLFWYELAVLMTKGDVIPVPEDYSLSNPAAKVFNTISTMDFNSQLTVLRDAVIEMGPAA
ncbi:MAG: orange carotenoid protein N-terminal domain-containing protein [Cyanobacteria bacterium P01_H01_bin.21]